MAASHTEVGCVRRLTALWRVPRPRPLTGAEIIWMHGVPHEVTMWGGSKAAP